MKKYTLAQTKEELPALLKSKSSFQITGLSGKILETVKWIETAIEEQNLSCRVYTSGRKASLASGILAAPLTVWSALFMATHNVLTYNPDYEIEKHLIDNMLTVTYKK